MSEDPSAKKPSPFESFKTDEDVAPALKTIKVVAIKAVVGLVCFLIISGVAVLAELSGDREREFLKHEGVKIAPWSDKFIPHITAALLVFMVMFSVWLALRESWSHATGEKDHGPNKTASPPHDAPASAPRPPKRPQNPRPKGTRRRH